MKHIVFSIIVLISIQGLAQNVGIGTTDPTYKVTVIPDVNGNGIVQDGLARTGFHTNSNWGATLKTFGSASLYFATNNSPTPMMTIGTNQNVGIGIANDAPGFKLDLGGRLRLQHNTALNQTAGIWFDGTFNDNRSFLGTVNEDHVGLYGNAGAGWNFVMNVENGNTGIGISAPTAKLDLNGELRIRGGAPKKGSILTSTDNNGNATWQPLVMFRSWGIPLDSLQSTPGSWIKWDFSPTVVYNYGLHYQPLASQFVAPVKGIYQFKGQLGFQYSAEVTGIRMRCLRNGVTTTLVSNIDYGGEITISGTQYALKRDDSNSFSTELLIEAGDILWLEFYTSEEDDYTYNYGSQSFMGELLFRL
jgi:hypothetical protein